MPEFRGSSSLPESWLDACLRLTGQPTELQLVSPEGYAHSCGLCSLVWVLLFRGRGNSVESRPGAPGGSSPVPPALRAPALIRPSLCPPAWPCTVVGRGGLVGASCETALSPPVPRRGVFWCPRVAQLCCWGDILGALPTRPAGPCLKPLVPTRTRTVVRTSCLVRGRRRPARVDVVAGAVVFPDPDSRLHGSSLCAELFPGWTQPF